jgi:hypothetical protein
MDIDIDFADRKKALEVINHRVASRHEDGVLKPHNTGIYLQDQTVRAPDLLCEIPYDKDVDGRFKIDFLNASLYNGIQNRDHLKRLAEQEPLWDLLEQDEFVNLLFHVNGHGSILRQMKPKSVEELAAVLAMIRPAKRYLVGKEWSTILKEVWQKPENDDYYFKKSHATAYALAIVCQMNLICEQISYGYS